jgi:C-mannosyltransferase DPY19L
LSLVWILQTKNDDYDDDNNNGCNKITKLIKKLFLFLSTLFYLLPWQFAQFSLATQLIALFIIYSLNLLQLKTLITILKIETLALFTCFILMYANKMLLSSLFGSIILTIWTLISIEKLINKVFAASNAKEGDESLTRVIVSFATRIFSFISIFIIIKKSKIISLTINSHDDDSHIWDILQSKFNKTFATFDTRLYTCAKEFDFIEFETLKKLTQTG